MPRKSPSKTQKQLVVEKEDLQVRLDEAEDTLRAIRNGEVDALIISGVDGEQIFALKQAEEKLAASEAELHTLFAAMTDVVVVYDSDGRYLQIAPTNPINLYRPQQDLLGKTVHEILPKEQADFFIDKIREAIQTNKVVLGEYFLPIGGEQIWFAFNISRLSENTVIWVAHDITQSKQAEVKLKSVSTRQEAILAAIPDILLEVDKNKVYTWANQAGLDFFGVFI